MKKLEVRFTRDAQDSMLVGTLAERLGQVYFEYSAEFLDSGHSLSPFRLPFELGLFEHRHHDFGPLPGLFDDSLPDGWGLFLMDRHFRSLNWKLEEISPLDRLSWLGTRTMGALTYHPPSDSSNVDASVFDLHNLARHSQKLHAGDVSEVLPELLRAGGSPGGARPKVLVGFNPQDGTLISGEDDLPSGLEHWIVKFFAKTDTPDFGAIEYAYSLLAAKAGIDMPPTKLFETSGGDRYFGIQRFDRDNSSANTNRRFHVHTFGNLIQSNFRIPSADYADLLKVTYALTRNFEDVIQVFRRMVFNVCAHNRDDHVKNFAFLLNDTTGEWSISPAYDLVFTHGPGGEHSMTLANEGKNPKRSHLLELASRFDIDHHQANSIISEVQTAMKSWGKIADSAGVTKVSAKEINNAFCTL